MELSEKDKHDLVIESLEILGEKYQSRNAERMLYAIAYQESNFEFRHQIGGPAVGFWQFEKGGGVKGVLNHHTTKEEAKRICEYFKIQADECSVYENIPKNDKLACCFARLLLWTDYRALPNTESEGWGYYLNIWRPGRPHPERWSHCWSLANKILRL